MRTKSKRVIRNVLCGSTRNTASTTFCYGNVIGTLLSWPPPPPTLTNFTINLQHLFCPSFLENQNNTVINFTHPHSKIVNRILDQVTPRLKAGVIFYPTYQFILKPYWKFFKTKSLYCLINNNF